jgi:hypothetical protein
MNTSTLAHIIQQLITAKEENDSLIEECARLNQMLHPLVEQEPEIQQEPEIEQPEIEQEEQEPTPGAATSIARAWPISGHASDEANL